VFAVQKTLLLFLRLSASLCDSVIRVHTVKIFRQIGMHSSTMTYRLHRLAQARVEIARWGDVCPGTSSVDVFAVGGRAP
jgi:hypothetical protein